jgi:uncharacterized protein
MQLVDANVLLYAVDRRSHHHEEAAGWLDGALNGRETVAFSWAVLLAFVRLGTHPAVFPHPLTVAEAMATARAWLGQPTAVVIEPTTRHLQVLEGLLDETGTAGNLVADAHLAALAIEHACELVSYDADFARFAGVRWRRP